MSEPKKLVVLNFNNLSPVQSRRMHQLARNHGGERLSVQKVVGQNYNVQGFDLSGESLFLKGEKEKVRLFVFPDNVYSTWHFSEGLRALGFDRQITYRSYKDSAKPTHFHRHIAAM